MTSTMHETEEERRPSFWSSLIPNWPLKYRGIAKVHPSPPLRPCRQEPAKMRPILSSPPTTEIRPEPKSDWRSCHPTPAKSTNHPPSHRNPSISEDEVQTNALIGNVKISWALLGEAHPATILAYNALGHHSFNRGKFGSAIEAYKHALRCYILGSKNTPKDQLAIAATLGNIGAACWRMGRIKEAIQSLEEAYFMQVQAFSGATNEFIQVNADALAKTLFDLGVARTLDRDHDNALNAFTRARDIIELRHGTAHAEMARVVDMIGRVYLMKGDADMAIKWHSYAFEVKCAILDSSHPSVLASMMNVAAARRANNDLIEAGRIYMEVLSARTTALDKESNQERRRALAADIGKTNWFIRAIRKEWRSKSREESLCTVVEEEEKDAC